MSSRVRRTTILVLSTAAAAAFLVTPATDAAARGPGFCGQSGFGASHRFVWTGAAHDGIWQTAANWNRGGTPSPVAPGDPESAGGPGNLDDPSRAVDYVCIGQEPGGSPAAVTLGGQFFAGAAVSALDLGQGATLTVTGNSRLWLNGPTATRVSTIRVGSTLTLLGATLGGVGTLTVGGVLDAATTAAFPVTITTRWCDVGTTPCATAAPNPGRIVVSAGGTLAVDGTPAAPASAGINIEDSRYIDNAGTIRIANAGYIAADRGTMFQNRAGGTIEIANDRGIYEGRNRYGALPTLSNSGLLLKSAGTGTSIVALDSPPTGQVKVDVGTLTIDRSSATTGVAVPTATVAAGGTYGLGSCPRVVTGNPQPCTSVSVDATSPQAATATLSSVGGTSSVTIETQTTGLPAGHIGQAVQFVTPTSTPTTANPNIFVMLYDQSIRPSGGLDAFTMMRAPDNSNAFVTVPVCRANGTPPQGSSCVDRRGIPGVSSQIIDGDAKIVIRTTQNSRWVGV